MQYRVATHCNAQDHLGPFLTVEYYELFIVHLILIVGNLVTIVG